MHIKAIARYAAGLCLLAASAVAAQDGMGNINALDPNRQWISIDNDDFVIDPNVRVLTYSGRTRTTGHLTEHQAVNYTLNKYGRVSEIRIYDPRKLLEQGFYTSEDLNH